MLDSVPQESEWRSWTWVLLCIGLIYATIPLARMLVESIDEQFGRDFFLYACVVLAALVGNACWRNLRLRQLSWSAHLWLLAVLGVFAFALYQLRSIPEEALHLAQYALLGVLAYRALSHGVHDYSIYPLGFLLTSMVGMVDEYIQWTVPSRYFDLRDIAINAFSGLLAQVGLAMGLRPGLVARRPSARNWRRLGNWGVAALLLLMISFVNTPQRVAWYVTQLPVLEFLLDGNSMMAQYGFLHRSSAGGEFRSRFDQEQLQRLDRERGVEVAGIVDRYLPEQYPEFLDRYSVLRDPYAHEIGVHLFSRIRHAELARENSETQHRHYFVAYHENAILEAFFPTALYRSRFAWDSAKQNEFREAGGHSGTDYLSRVSGAVITRVSEGQAWLLLGLACVLVLTGSRFAAKRLAGTPR